MNKKAGESLNESFSELQQTESWDNQQHRSSLIANEPVSPAPFNSITEERNSGSLELGPIAPKTGKSTIPKKQTK